MLSASSPCHPSFSIPLRFPFACGLPPARKSEANSQAIAEITIETNKKTRTFDVMPDVNEETLKNNLGHLPSSALPEDEGLCVIMGHRDTQFSILRYCEIGDRIIIKSEDRTYIYTVNYIKIVDSGDILQFDTVYATSIILVTCYLFWYTGHAPQKIVFYANQIIK